MTYNHMYIDHISSTVHTNILFFAQLQLKYIRIPIANKIFNQVNNINYYKKT